MEELDEKEKEILNNRLDIGFYSNYSVDKIESKEDFQEIPTIRKGDILSDDYIMFKDQFLEDSIEFNYTSGTTDNPTVVLRSRDDLENQRETWLKLFDQRMGDKIYVVLSSTIVMNGLISELKDMDKFFGYSTPYNIGFCKRAIRDLEIDTLWTTPSIALKLGEMLQENGKAEKVDYLALLGEPLSDLKYRKLKEIYGNVRITSNYGSIETSGLGYQCKHLQGTSRFHAQVGKNIFEILDFEDDTPVEEGYGELTITKRWENSYTPLLRYRTGDKARWVETDCECGEGLAYELGGRVKFDSFKLSGFTVYREKFETALDPVADLISGVYQIHIKEVEEDEKLKPKVEIHLTPENDMSEKLMDESEMKDDIAENFAITDSFSYKELVEKGILAEMEVVLKDSVFSGGKTQTVVDHRS